MQGSYSGRVMSVRWEGIEKPEACIKDPEWDDSKENSSEFEELEETKMSDYMCSILLQTVMREKE